MGFKINVAKTKICVFEKRKQVHREEFFISNEKCWICRTIYLLGCNLFTYGQYVITVITRTSSVVIVRQGPSYFKNKIFFVWQNGCPDHTLWGGSMGAVQYKGSGQTAPEIL